MPDTPDTSETPAKIVRRARGKLSLDAFAAELGTSRQRVIAWEKGRSVPSEGYAQAIAERVGLTPDDLTRANEDAATVTGQIAEVQSLLLDLVRIAEARGLTVPGSDDWRLTASEVSVIATRLRRVEEKVDQMAQTTAESLANLAEAIAGLSGQLPASEPDSRRRSTQ